MFSFIKSAYGNARVKTINKATVVCTLTGSGPLNPPQGIWLNHAFIHDHHCYALNHVVGRMDCRSVIEQHRHQFKRISEIARRGDPHNQYDKDLEAECDSFPLHFFARHPPVDRDLYLLVWQILDLLEGRRVSLERIALGL